MRIVLAWAVVFLLAASIRVGAAETSPDPSNHVPLDHWAYGAMAYLVEAGVYENQRYYGYLFSGVDEIERTRKNFEDAVSWALFNTEYVLGESDESRPPFRLASAMLFELEKWLSSQEWPMSTEELYYKYYVDHTRRLTDDVLNDLPDTWAMRSPRVSQSAYDEVPPEHWGYGVLDYLAEEGVLTGFPDGFFKEKRVLTRYEFAQATARLQYEISTIGCSYTDFLLAEALRYEFYDQLSQLGRDIF